MSDRNLKKLLANLHNELERTNHVDDDLKDLVSQLGDDIDRLLQPENDLVSADSTSELATLLETRFSANHPVAAKFLQEIVEALAKMGV